MKFFGKFLAGVALVATLAGAAACGGTPKDSTGSAEVTVGTFKKDLYFENWSAFSVKNENHSYARIVEADDGTLIATGEDEKNGLRNLQEHGSRQDVYGKRHKGARSQLGGVCI